MFDDILDRLSDALSDLADSVNSAFSDLTGGMFGGGDEPPEPPTGNDFDEPEADDFDRGYELSVLLNENTHPSDLPDWLDDQEIEEYTDKLIEKLDLNGDWDDGNHTERSLYATYDDLVDYLNKFNGGYPDDDLIEIELTDEGYLLYVAIDTP